MIIKDWFWKYNWENESEHDLLINGWFNYMIKWEKEWKWFEKFIIDLDDMILVSIIKYVINW
jgi:hypothetical protein